MSDLNPSTDDVLQEEAHPVAMTPIPVTVEGPARVQQLPAHSAGMRSYDLVPDGAQKVLDADPRRKRAVLQAVGDLVMFGPSQAAAMAGGAVFAAGTLIELTTCDEVWARSATTPPAACRMGVINEQWAE